MEKNKVISYVFMILGVISLIVLIIGVDSFSTVIKVVLTMLFSSFFAIGYVNFTHMQLLKKDKEYSLEVNDERHISIKEKTGNIVNIINVFILGVVTVIFIFMEYYIPAAIIGGLLIIQPVLMILVSNYYEKKL